MKKLLFTLLSLIAIHCAASEPIKMGVMTDMHYLSEKLMDNGYAMNNAIYNNGKNLIVVPEVLDKVLEDYMNSDIEVLLIPGDLSKDGEKQSHIDFNNKLKPLYEKGVKIFVVPGNHDINMPNSVKYQGNKITKTDNVTSKEFEEIYENYGYKQAIKRDVQSLSYVAELNSSTWLLTIDAARYEEYKDKPITAGKIKESTESWILNILAEAKEQDKQVIAMMHWGVVEHIPYQATVFKEYVVDDHKRIATLLADNGVNLVFTGHFHSNDISEFTSTKGNKIYDIETGPLVSYPFPYRFAELSKDKIKINTKHITSTTSFPNLEQENKDLMKRVAKDRALPMLKSLGFQFSEGHLAQIAEIAGELFVLHLYGDEIVDDSIKQRLVDILTEMDFPMEEGLNDLELDLPPSDNNVTLHF